MAEECDIHCCIVDDHCDIIPFIHSFWRINKIPHDKNVVLVHFDAHPDLSITCPTQSRIDDWKDKDKLYDLLNEPGGISEFIIPLFVNKLINQLVWIKPEWSDQFDVGSYNFDIFEEYNNTVNTWFPKTNCESSYYIDEGVFSSNYDNNSEKKATLSKDKYEVNLITCSSDCLLKFDNNHLFTLDNKPFENKNNNKKKNEFDASTEWILDICLDFFSTHNPFIITINETIAIDIKINNDQLDSLDVFDIIKNSIKFMKYRSSTIDISYRTKSIEIFNNLLSYYYFVNNSNNNSDDNELKNNDILKELYLNLYDNNNINHAINFLEILPYLSDRTRNEIKNNWTLLLLPHRESSMEEIDFYINKMTIFIRNNLINNNNKFKSNPLFITIAKSSDDGYTPNNQLEYIYNKIIDNIKSLFSCNEIKYSNNNNDNNNNNNSNYNSDNNNKMNDNRNKMILVIHDFCNDSDVDHVHKTLLNWKYKSNHKINNNKRKFEILQDHGIIL